MWNRWNDSRKKKYALLGVTSLIMVMSVLAQADESINPSQKPAEIHRESKLVMTQTAVNIICASTDYKEDCTTSLSSVRSLDPRMLIRSAFDLSMASIRSGIEKGMVDLRGRADADVHTKAALISCQELMDYAIDDLRKTRDKFGLFLFSRLSDFVEDLCVWLSGSITYQQTCIDGFDGIDSEAAMIMERVMRKSQHLTSNGLAIASNLDNLLKAFRIPFPFLNKSRRDGLGLGLGLGSGSAPGQQLESSGDPAVGSSVDPPSDSSENQPLDSEKSTSSENQPLDSQKPASSENQPSGSPEEPPQNSISSENQPSGSSEKAPKTADSSENQPTSPPGNSDSSLSSPLDPLRKLNPLRHLNPLNSDRQLSEGEDFPRWVTRHSRRLLAPRGGGRQIRANVVVAKDGKIKTIGQALAMVPKKNTKRFVIHIKQGVYKEKVEVTKQMTNVMFVGDGPTKTIITGDIAFLPNRVGTYLTATVAVNGDNFMARDIGFENTAGAARHQAVALRVSADFAVFFNCRMDGHQDTLYVHTHRQFYRDCRISGTIDFVFGDAKAVFQKCDFVIRRPMDNQQCIVTAQGRKDKRETTGIVIHNSRIIGDATFRSPTGKNKAYLGRPWKEFSRTIIMNSEIDSIIDPEGWLKWNETFALNTLFYGEYRNRGRGAGLARRVRWKGIRRITDRDAKEFTPENFLRGSKWIPQTRVPFNAN